MSIRIAGDLVSKAKKEERTRCVRILLKHVRRQCSGKCCDNCSCLGMKNALAELRGEKS